MNKKNKQPSAEGTKKVTNSGGRTPESVEKPSLKSPWFLYTNDHLTNWFLGVPVVDAVFRHIHPNLITFVGFLFGNLTLLYCVSTWHVGPEARLLNTSNKGLLNPPLFAVGSFVHLFADDLDGAVARKYSKCSRLGHQLDDFSDKCRDFILLAYGIQRVNYHPIAIALFTAVAIIPQLAYNMRDSHDLIKDYRVCPLLAFLVNNQWVCCLLTCSVACEWDFGYGGNLALCGLAFWYPGIVVEAVVYWVSPASRRAKTAQQGGSRGRICSKQLATKVSGNGVRNTKTN